MCGVFSFVFWLSIKGENRGVLNLPVQRLWSKFNTLSFYFDHFVIIVHLELWPSCLICMCGGVWEKNSQKSPECKSCTSYRIHTVYWDLLILLWLSKVAWCVEFSIPKVYAKNTRMTCYIRSDFSVHKPFRFMAILTHNPLHKWKWDKMFKAHHYVKVVWAYCLQQFILIKGRCRMCLK